MTPRFFSLVYTSYKMWAFECGRAMNMMGYHSCDQTVNQKRQLLGGGGCPSQVSPLKDDCQRDALLCYERTYGWVRDLWSLGADSQQEIRGSGTQPLALQEIGPLIQRNYKTINLYCFKSLSLLLLIGIKNLYNEKSKIKNSVIFKDVKCKYTRYNMSRWMNR